ncbi:MAG: YggS family pyridoxal phosphate-dependent enzyme [Burkholderiaceae bacterium]
MTTIAAHLEAVRTRIAAACQRFGRDPASVQLLAVSKTFPPEAVREAMQAGQWAFGENYVQEGVDKTVRLREWQAAGLAPAGPLQWHCIGPLQSNKTRPVAEHFDWVHSVDRLKIAQRLSEQRPAGLPRLQVCIQVNVDGGPTKSGVAPAETLALARAVATLPRLSLRGLMCIPEPSDSFEAACAVFGRARALMDEMRDALQPDLRAQGLAPDTLDTLSMGMSADLEAAIASGSTLVRVGTAIFGAR